MGQSSPTGNSSSFESVHPMTSSYNSKVFSSVLFNEARSILVLPFLSPTPSSPLSPLSPSPHLWLHHLSLSPLHHSLSHFFINLSPFASQFHLSSLFFSTLSHFLLFSLISISSGIINKQKNWKQPECGPIRVDLNSAFNMSLSSDVYTMK